MHTASPLSAAVPQRGVRRPFVAASAAPPYNVVITGSTKGPAPAPLPIPLWVSCMTVEDAGSIAPRDQ